MFDYFKVDLVCPACGAVSSDTSTNMQTKIAVQPKLAVLSEGQRIDADWGDVCSAGYLRISPPPSPDSIRLLETWDCPQCRKPFNWARVDIDKSMIRRIEASKLTYDVVRSVNYITKDCQFFLPDQGAGTSVSTVDSLLAFLKGEEETSEHQE